MNSDNSPKPTPKYLMNKNLVVLFTIYDEANSEELVDESKLKLFLDRVEGAKEVGGGTIMFGDKIYRQQKAYTLGRALREGEAAAENKQWELIEGDQVTDLLAELVVAAGWSDGETPEPIRRYRLSRLPHPQADPVTAQELLDLLLELVEPTRTE